MAWEVAEQRGGVGGYLGGPRRGACVGAAPRAAAAGHLLVKHLRRGEWQELRVERRRGVGEVQRGQLARAQQQQRRRLRAVAPGGVHKETTGTVAPSLGAPRQRLKHVERPVVQSYTTARAQLMGTHTRRCASAVAKSRRCFRSQSP